MNVGFESVAAAATHSGSIATSELIQAEISV
jgi:hypothetical protein